MDLTEDLIRRHQQALWRYLRFLGAPPPLADDLTQEAFLSLLQSAPEDRGDAATAGWLRTVARRLFARHGRRRRGLEVATDADLEAAWLAGEGHKPTAGDDYADALDPCLADLTPRARRVLDLRYRDELSREAMATALSMSPEGVKTLLRRTREALQACVEDRIQRASGRTQR